MTSDVTELLTLPDAARILRVSPWTVRQEVAAGRLRAVRVGRQWRTTVAWVNAYLDANATGPEVNDAEALRGGVGLSTGPGRQVGGDVGGRGEREAAAHVQDGAHKGRGHPSPEGSAARRGIIELEVAKPDRKRRRVPRSVAS